MNTYDSVTRQGGDPAIPVPEDQTGADRLKFRKATGEVPRARAETGPDPCGAAGKPIKIYSSRQPEENTYQSATPK